MGFLNRVRFWSPTKITNLKLTIKKYILKKEHESCFSKRTKGFLDTCLDEILKKMLNMTKNSYFEANKTSEPKHLKKYNASKKSSEPDVQSQLQPQNPEPRPPLSPLKASEQNDTILKKATTFKERSPKASSTMSTKHSDPKTPRCLSSEMRMGSRRNARI